ncbi:HPr-rel-A system PqqD family peptide chaperone [Sphingobium sp. AP49]|uniref:HPr-rel-A system PqqD family peptide chaperone n=1 Tax=Sphingobium sp. AP49 TaxID=1144307 RepID=UPI00026EE551|nr:HPr-rel-A system PqqD family peptide chaperone [Sphingobium sp. AP49]WHO40207.1 HPr-rel-A system PqqD family peptide chaperone [Sphingobium sp. AP49]
MIIARALDDIVLLYHRPSGQTHMVISPVPEILDAMVDGLPASATMLRDRLAQLYDLGEGDVVGEIGQHLAYLDRIGLVRPA